MKLIERRKRSILLFICDILIVLAATLMCDWFVRLPRGVVWSEIFLNWGIMSVLLLLSTLLFSTYVNVWRYAGSKELMMLINAYAITGIITVGFKHACGIGAPTWLILCSVTISALGSTYARTFYNSILRAGINASKDGLRPLAIIGAGAAGVALSRELSENRNSLYTVWGFFDDDPRKIGMTIAGIKVKGKIDEIPDIVRNSPVNDIILAIPSLELDRRREIISLCGNLKCRLKIMPEIIMTIGDGDTPLANTVRNVKTEDLLGRSTIIFRAEEMADFISGRTILVTGGGGSIGSELCRQIAKAGAKDIIIFDLNENTSYLLQQELEHMCSDVNIVVEIGSMVDEKRVKDVFRTYHPQVVFHAAAHKHVPLMEHCPYEAVWNNIFGSYNIIKAVSEYKVNKMVLISTDKAVNPTSIMGATKRYCEEMMRAISTTKENCTCFVSVRFGNVLGSDGSVVPIFQKQIAHGGPVTVTDKRMTRFFMTISEAVGLVLKAGAMASASETYILDMGKPMKIIDMAENLIRLSGLRPYVDIPIVEVGLRPGEKLMEELLINDERHIATKETKIFVEKNEGSMNWQALLDQLDELKAAVDSVNSEQVFELMKKYVPSYGETVRAKELAIAKSARETSECAARKDELVTV